jgi:hypothetical protein
MVSRMIWSVTSFHFPLRFAFLMCVCPRYMVSNGESDGGWFELGSSFEGKFGVNLFLADEASCEEDAEGYVAVPQRFDDLDEGAQGVRSCSGLAWMHHCFIVGFLNEVFGDCRAFVMGGGCIQCTCTPWLVSHSQGTCLRATLS